MSRLFLCLCTLLITLFGASLQAMDSALKTRVVQDVVYCLDNTDVTVTAKTFYESKHAENPEYKILLLTILFITHAHVDYRLATLEYLCQQIDLLDSDSSQVAFNNTGLLLAAIVQHQSHDAHGDLCDINHLLSWCIDRGTPVDGDSYNASPLAIAINIAHEDAVHLLLEHNADVYRVVETSYDHPGQTLLDFAHTTQQQLTTYPEAREAIKDAVIDHALSPVMLWRIRDRLRGNGILDFVHQMLQYTDYEGFIIRRLLNFCASLNGGAMAQEIQLLLDRTITTDKILNNEECNELVYNLIRNYPNGDAGMMSAHSTLPAWITWCINHGAPINIPTQDGMTPLMSAVAGGGRNQVRAYDDVIAILMNAGANPDQACTLGDGTYTPKSFLEKRLEKYKGPENLHAKALLSKAAVPATPPSDPTAAAQKTFSVSLPKIGLLCAGAVITYMTLHRLYAWVYPEQDDEVEDVEDDAATQEPIAKTDNIG